MQGSDLLSIGEIATRAGVAASAIRYYEVEGLLPPPQRTDTNRRRYPRETLRRIAFIRTAQQVGLTLEAIKAALDSLPQGRVPTAEDWTSLSQQWKRTLDQQIEAMERLRSDLDSCIGCGCLSLERCALYNPEDRAAALGHGPRYWKGNTAADVGAGARPGAAGA